MFWYQKRRKMILFRKKKKSEINPRTLVYIHAAPETNEFVYTGIEFYEFIEYVSPPVENLMHLGGMIYINTGDDFAHTDTEDERGLDLFEGRGKIQKLSKLDIYGFGDFCVADYALPRRTGELSEHQLAELLYMGHMFRALHSPFFEPLQNRFAYLAHDDGWYCKLYCRDPLEFAPVLCGKIRRGVRDVRKAATGGIPAALGEEMLAMAPEGLLIDLDEVTCEKGLAEVKLYCVGKYEDMDDVLNSRQELKQNATRVRTLSYSGDSWILAE